MPYYKTTIVAGRTIEVIKGYSKMIGNHNKRSARRNKTPEEVERINQRQAEARLRRLINANFGEGDIHLVLTYKKNDRPDPAEAKKRIDKFIRRLRTRYKKLGVELKYIHVTEYATSAIHHHLIINSIDSNLNKLIRECWPHGSPHLTPLDDTGQYKDLAAYLIKETSKTFKDPEAVHKQRYSTSKNLKKPHVKTVLIDSERWREDPKPIKGYLIDKTSVENGVSEWSGRRFQRYTMIRQDYGGRKTPEILLATRRRRFQHEKSKDIHCNKQQLPTSVRKTVQLYS